MSDKCRPSTMAHSGRWSFKFLIPSFNQNAAISHCMASFKSKIVHVMRCTLLALGSLIKKKSPGMRSGEWWEEPREHHYFRKSGISEVFKGWNSLKLLQYEHWLRPVEMRHFEFLIHFILFIALKSSHRHCLPS